MGRPSYDEWIDGAWDDVHHSAGMDVQCCDCGLVHSLKFKIVKRGEQTRLRMQVKRNERATAAVRRAFKFKKERDD